MRKRLWLSGGGIIAAYAMVAGTALAVFSPQAQGSLTLRTASYSLKVSNDPSSTPPANTAFSQNVALTGAQDMYPGMNPVAEKIWLYNDSESGKTLSLKSAFRSGDQNWEELKYAVQVNLVDVSTQAEGGWMSLGELEQTPWPLVIPTLSPNEKRQIEIQYTMPSNYPVDPDGAGPLQMDDPIGNEVMGKQTSGAAFVIDGLPEEQL